MASVIFHTNSGFLAFHRISVPQIFLFRQHKLQPSLRNFSFLVSSRFLLRRISLQRSVIRRLSRPALISRSLSFIINMPGDHGGGCSCRDEATAVGIGQSKWLNSAIAIDQVVCLNSEEGEIKDVVRKTYDERLDDDKGFVRSPEDDNELLVHIPFSSPVALTSIYVIGGEAGRR